MKRLLDFWNFWKKIPTYILDRWPDYDTIKKTKKNLKFYELNDTEWTKVISKLIEDFASDYGLSFRKEVVQEIPGTKRLRKNDYTLYNADEDPIFHIEHENRGDNIFNEFVKLEYSDAPNKVIIGYLTWPELRYTLSRFLLPALGVICSENLEQKWLLILGGGKTTTWTLDSIDSWVGYIVNNVNERIKTIKLDFEEP